jgi:hypothetical protein
MDPEILEFLTYYPAIMDDNQLFEVSRKIEPKE